MDKAAYTALEAFLAARLPRDDAFKARDLALVLVETTVADMAAEIETLHQALGKSDRDPDGVDMGDPFPVWLLWRLDTASGAVLAGIASTAKIAIQAKKYVEAMTNDPVRIEPTEANHLFAQRALAQGARG